MSRVFSNELRVLVERENGKLNRSNPFRYWNFREFIGNKMISQLEKYPTLPTLNDLINMKLEQLYPLYANQLETGIEDSQYNLYFRKFIANDDKSIKLNNLKAHIIKHEIHNEYFEISEFRKSQISFLQNEELVVHTYTDVKLIEFIKLLHDDTFLNSSYYNYYKRFRRLFLNVLEDKDSGICRKLRPNDLEKLIQILIYSNHKLRSNERLELKLDEINRLLLNDLQRSDLKLSNKEMFALLQQTFHTTVNTENIENLYDRFLNSEEFDKNQDFFKNMLNVNISLGFNNNRMVSKDFTRKIILDLLNTDLKLDRMLLKYILKYSWLVRDTDLTYLIVVKLFEDYSIDNETFNMIFAGIASYGTESGILNELVHINNIHNKKTTLSISPSVEANRFNIRILDHLDEKCRSVASNRGALCPGITHKLAVNTFPGNS